MSLRSFPRVTFRVRAASETFSSIKTLQTPFRSSGSCDRANSISSNLNGSSSKTQKSPEAFSVPGLSKSSSSDVRLKYQRFFAKTRLSTLGVCLDKNADRYVGSEDFVSSYVARNLLSTTFLKASAISSVSVWGRLYRLASFRAVISICFSAYVSMRTDRFLSTALSITATKVFYINRYKFSPKKIFAPSADFPDNICGMETPKFSKRDRRKRIAEILAKGLSRCLDAEYKSSNINGFGENKDSRIVAYKIDIPQNRSVSASRENEKHK